VTEQVRENPLEGSEGIGRDLTLTRYCFTSKLYCGSQSSFYCPPTCKSYPIAILVYAHFAIYAPPQTNNLLYAIHYTILAMAISCKGQVATLRVEYAERGTKCGILFLFSLFCEYINLEYINLEYVRVPVIYRVDQVE